MNKLARRVVVLLIPWLLAGCGNESTTEGKPMADNKAASGHPDKPAVRFLLDGRLIESTDYSCSWLLTGKQNIFNLTVHYDRQPKKVPPNAGFNVYNLESIVIPIRRLYGNKLSGQAGQLYSLSMTIPNGKANDMNEQSFTDNYAGLESGVQLSLLDTTAKLVSGSFEGTVQNANNKSIKITGGKFERIPLKMVYR